MSDAVEINLKSEVIYWQKMDVPKSDWGFYVVLNIDEVFEITRWKISKLDAINIFSCPMENVEKSCIWVYVDPDGLKQFIAGKIGELFQGMRTTITSDMLGWRA